MRGRVWEDHKRKSREVAWEEEEHLGTTGSWGVGGRRVVPTLKEKRRAGIAPRKKKRNKMTERSK